MATRCLLRHADSCVRCFSHLRVDASYEHPQSRPEELGTVQNIRLWMHVIVTLTVLILRAVTLFERSRLRLSSRETSSFIGMGLLTTSKQALHTYFYDCHP